MSHLPTRPHRREVGAPCALAPSPPPRCSMLSPGPPQHSTGAPLAPARARARPLGAARSCPARPGPAPPPPSRRPRPRPAPARPEWAVREERGRGPRGVPAPGRGHAPAPHVTRARQGARRGGAERSRAERRRPRSLPERPHDCVCVGRLGRRETRRRAGHPLSLPGPEGRRQPVIVPAQRVEPRRGARPSPSAALPDEASPPRSPASRSERRPSEGQPSLSARRLPGTSRGTGSGACLSHPQQAGGHPLGSSEAAPPGGPFQPPTSAPRPTPAPHQSHSLPLQSSSLRPRAWACPWHGSRLPSLTSGSRAMRKVAAQTGGGGCLHLALSNGKSERFKPTLALQQTSQCLSQGHTYVYPFENSSLNTHKTFPTLGVRQPRSLSRPSRGSTSLHSITLRANSQNTGCSCLSCTDCHNSPSHPVTILKYTPNQPASMQWQRYSATQTTSYIILTNYPLSLRGSL